MLSLREQQNLDYFYNLESSLNINISNRVNLERKIYNFEKFATVDQITTKLSSLRFVHQTIFELYPKIFFDAVNYTFRAIGEKTVELKIFVFLMNAAYIVSVEQGTKRVMTQEEKLLLLSMTNFCTSYLDDMDRMKVKLCDLIKKNFFTVTILNYLELILNFSWNPNHVFAGVIDLAMILSTNCQLTKYGMACQALSLVSWVARHVDIDPAINKKLSTLPKIPTLFFSPSRINQFSQYLKIPQSQIEQCCCDMQEFYIEYYSRLSHRKEKRKEIHKRRPVVIAYDKIIEENESEPESKSCNVRQLSYSFKPWVGLKNHRNGDSFGPRRQSKNRLRNIKSHNRSFSR